MSQLKSEKLLLKSLWRNNGRIISATAVAHAMIVVDPFAALSWGESYQKLQFNMSHTSCMFSLASLAEKIESNLFGKLNRRQNFQCAGMFAYFCCCPELLCFMTLLLREELKGMFSCIWIIWFDWSVAWLRDSRTEPRRPRTFWTPTGRKRPWISDVLPETKLNIIDLWISQFDERARSRLWIIWNESAENKILKSQNPSIFSIWIHELSDRNRLKPIERIFVNWRILNKIGWTSESRISSENLNQIRCK